MRTGVVVLPGEHSGTASPSDGEPDADAFDDELADLVAPALAADLARRHVRAMRRRHTYGAAAPVLDQLDADVEREQLRQADGGLVDLFVDGGADRAPVVEHPTRRACPPARPEHRDPWLDPPPPPVRLVLPPDDRRRGTDRSES